MKPHAARWSLGVTLIELVVALAVTAIVASFAVSMIAAPPATLDASARRAGLRDNAAQGMDVIQREWRDVLPNSLRARTAGGVLALEHLAVLDQAALFRDVTAVPANLRLSLGIADAQFETLGGFARIAKPYNSTAAYIALHHTGAVGANAWALSDVISPRGTRVRIDAGSVPGQDRVRLTPAVRYTSVGPSRRVYLLSGPVTYLCNSTTGTLNRYAGYRIAANQAQRDSDSELMAAGATRATLATGVSNCRYTTTPSTSAGQVVQQLSVSFRSGTDQVQLAASRVNDNAG